MYLIKSNKGFSLHEALASIGLLSAVVFSFLSWTSNYQMSLSNINQSSEVGNSMLRIASAFGDEEASCINILGSKSYDPAYEDGINIPSIDYYNSSKSIVGNVIKIGEPVPQTVGIKVSGIRLKPSVIISAQTSMANLEVSFKKSNVLGPSEVTRRIPVFVTTAGGQISSCTTSSVPTVLLKNRYCEVQNDGYSHYDAATDACVDDDKVKWFISPDPELASCPMGYKLATRQSVVSSASQTLCRSVSILGTDVKSRTYRSGVIDTSKENLYIAEVDTTISTCEFMFVDTEDPKNFTSSIKCVADESSTL